MPSFDVVSDFDAHEASNAVDQANREVNTRFDFKGTGSKYELEDQVVTMTSQSDFQLQQMLDILQQKLVKRGIDTDRARKLVKQIKGAKLKVQAAIQGDKLRVSGKKRDDLQSVIAMLKQEDIGLPLQYENFRD